MKSNKAIAMNVVLLVLACACSVAAFLLYKRNLITPLAFYVPLLGVAYTFALIFILALGWSFENKSRLLLISGSVFCAVYAFELALSCLPLQNPNPQMLRQRLAQKQGIAFDKRNKFEIMNELQAQNKMAWPNISPEYFIESNGIPFKDIILFPVGAGIASADTILCNESGQFSHYQSDEYGFNNPKGLMHAPVNMLVIGDSFAHGACVNEGYDIASFLRKSEPRTVNLGSSGIGPLLELASLTEYGSKLRPKKVFWLYFEGNDLADLAYEANSPLLLNYLNDNFSQDLFAKQADVNEALINYISTKKQDFMLLYKPATTPFSLAGWLKLRNVRKQLQLNKAQQPATAIPMALFETVLATAQRRVNHWGGELVVVYMPELARFQAKDKAAFDKLKHKSEVIAILNRLHIKTIDLEPVFTSQADPLALFPFKIEGHYTKQGYELVAKAIAEADTSVSA